MAFVADIGITEVLAERSNGFGGISASLGQFSDFSTLSASLTYVIGNTVATSGANTVTVLGSNPTAFDAHDFALV